MFTISWLTLAFLVGFSSIYLPLLCYYSFLIDREIKIIRTKNND